MTLPLEKGYYAARATGTPILFGLSKNNNTEIAVEFEILDEAFPGETITWIGHFTDKTAARSIESLQIAGWEGDDLSELSGAPGSQLLTAEVSLTVEGEEYDGQWKPKVQWVNKPGGGKFAFKNELAGNDLKAFGAQYRSTVQSVRKAGGAPRKTAGSGSQTRPAPSGPGGGGAHPNAPGNDREAPRGARGPDDDIPFASADIGHEPSPIAAVLRWAF